RDGRRIRCRANAGWNRGQVFRSDPAVEDRQRVGPAKGGLMGVRGPRHAVARGGIYRLGNARTRGHGCVWVRGFHHQLLYAVLRASSRICVKMIVVRSSCTCRRFWSAAESAKCENDLFQDALGSSLLVYSTCTMMVRR